MKTRVALLPLVLMGTACAHVSKDELGAQLGELRTDLVQRMDDGDARLGSRMDRMEADLAALRTELLAMERELGVRVEEVESSLRVHAPLHFEFDRAEVLPGGLEVLDRFSAVTRRHHPGARITVEGFTDPSGSVAYNLRLGQRRADAVKEYLVSRGMPAEQIRTVSYGKSTERLVVPGAHGPGTAGWENRRVVLVIDHAGDDAGRVANGEAGKGEDAAEGAAPDGPSTGGSRDSITRAAR